MLNRQPSIKLEERREVSVTNKTPQDNYYRTFKQFCERFDIVPSGKEYKNVTCKYNRHIKRYEWSTLQQFQNEPFLTKYKPGGLETCNWRHVIRQASK